MMMVGRGFLVIGAVFALGAAGCASTPGLTPVGHDGYMHSVPVSDAMGGIAGARRLGLLAAEDVCGGPDSGLRVVSHDYVPAQNAVVVLFRCPSRRFPNM